MSELELYGVDSRSDIPVRRPAGVAKFEPGSGRIASDAGFSGFAVGRQPSRRTPLAKNGSYPRRGHLTLDSNTEAQFRDEMRESPWFTQYQSEFGEEPDLDTPGYDFRRAWRDGVRPTPDPDDNGRYKWPAASSGALASPMASATGTYYTPRDTDAEWRQKFQEKTGQNSVTLGITSPLDAQYWMSRNEPEGSRR